MPYSFAENEFTTPSISFPFIKTRIPITVKDQTFPDIPRMDATQRFIEAVAGKKLGDKHYEARVERFYEKSRGITNKKRWDEGFENYTQICDFADKVILFDKSERRREREAERRRESASVSRSVSPSKKVASPPKKSKKEMTQQERIQYERRKFSAKEAAKDLKYQKKEAAKELKRRQKEERRNSNSSSSSSSPRPSSSSSSPSRSSFLGRFTRRDSGVGFVDESGKNKKGVKAGKKTEEPRVGRPILQPSTNFQLRDRVLEEIEKNPCFPASNKGPVAPLRYLRETSPHKKQKSVDFTGTINVELIHSANMVDGLPETPLLPPEPVKPTAITTVKKILRLPVAVVEPVPKPVQYVDELDGSLKVKIRRTPPTIAEKIVLKDEIPRSAPIEIGDKLAKQRRDKHMEDEFMRNFCERNLHHCYPSDRQRFKLGNWSKRDVLQMAKFDEGLERYFDKYGEPWVRPEITFEMPEPHYF